MNPLGILARGPSLVALAVLGFTTSACGTGPGGIVRAGAGGDDRVARPATDDWRPLSTTRMTPPPAPGIAASTFDMFSDKLTVWVTPLKEGTAGDAGPLALHLELVGKDRRAETKPIAALGLWKDDTPIPGRFRVRSLAQERGGIRIALVLPATPAFTQTRGRAPFEAVLRAASAYLKKLAPAVEVSVFFYDEDGLEPVVRGVAPGGALETLQAPSPQGSKRSPGRPPTAATSGPQLYASLTHAIDDLVSQGQAGDDITFKSILVLTDGVDATRGDLQQLTAVQRTLKDKASLANVSIDAVLVDVSGDEQPLSEALFVANRHALPGAAPDAWVVAVEAEAEFTNHRKLVAFEPEPEALASTRGLLWLEVSTDDQSARTSEFVFPLPR